jgi:hypothetical protein
LLIGWDGARVHIVTYGKTKADCAAAARAQEFWLGRIREFSFKGKDHREYNEAGDRVVRCWCGQKDISTLAGTAEHGFKYCTPKGLSNG